MKIKKNKLKKKKFFLILIFLDIYCFYLNGSIIINTKIINYEISTIINFKNLTKEKHYFFSKVMKILKSNRNYYFIKTIGKSLKEDLNDIIQNNTIKIVQSNFPDSIFLPLVVLYRC